MAVQKADAPTLHVWDVGKDPPVEGAGPGKAVPKKRRLAKRVGVNESSPTPVENEHFVGHVMVLHRPAGEASKSNGPYAWYFSGKTRVWEIRIQGRFKTAPVGTVYAGSIFEEFNYAVKPAQGAKILMGVARRLIDKVLGVGMHISWGARQGAAAESDAPLAAMVAPFVGFDQIVRTSASEEPPALQTDISALGVRRNAMSSTAEWRTRVAELTTDLSTQDTFTFCSWGCSRFVNLTDWRYTSIAPMPVSISKMCDEWPLHAVMYSHNGSERDRDGEVHRESRKVYFVDLLIWSSRTPHNPALNDLYDFEETV
eukprot:CAMPEP_0119070090 /NCGR_PEP_ID=MMETSP1178-20130426/33695_1 /TAXON_ID=33656 /ORGANISM="unid sp, Strain CCMP2000" /LENGTH=312 /DNA_ID=CAMNT_0007051901 /DNA_START=27 /DNA_END=965 /DNA_ORIENTATION=+